MTASIRQDDIMTAKDELWVLALLLTLAAMLYLATWFIEGRPFPQEKPGAIVLPLGQEQVLNHQPD
jgi:hypothetical protein